MREEYNGINEREEGLRNVFSLYIIWYIFLAGLGAGAFVVGVAINLPSGNEALLRVSTQSLNPVTAGFLVAAVALPLSCVFLLCDLGNPARIMAVFAHPFISIVSVGAWIVGLSALIAVVTVALVVANKLSQAGLAALEAAGALLAVGVLIYTGLLLSEMPSVDFWNTWLLVALFAVSGLTCGFAASGLLGVSLAEPRGGEEVSDGARTVSALVELAVLAAYLLTRLFATDSARESMLCLFTGDMAGYFLGGVLLVGMAVPLACSALRRGIDSRALTLAAAGCALIGGWCLRYCVVNAAVVDVIAYGPLFA